MTAYNNSINFPNLTVKSSPTTSDGVLIYDAAANNIPKQATLSSLPFAGTTGGGLNLIATQTASSSSTIDFSGNITSSYDNYLIILNGITSTSAITMSMRFGTGGTPTWQSTNYLGCAQYFNAINQTLSNTGTTGILLIDSALNANQVISGYVWLYNMNETASSSFKYTNFNINYRNSSSVVTNYTGTSSWQDTTVVTSVRFFPSTGTFAQGTYKLYGLNQ